MTVLGHAVLFDDDSFGEDTASPKTPMQWHCRNKSCTTEMTVFGHSASFDRLQGEDTASPKTPMQWHILQ